MFAHGGGSVLISGGRSFSQGVLGMEIIVLSESPGVRAQRGPELFRSTDGTSEVRSVLLVAQPPLTDVLLHQNNLRDGAGPERENKNAEAGG